MTKKHKIRKSKHLLENKKGVDENVENILRMIGEEIEPAENEPAENEPDDSGNNFKKSKLSSLVKGFHDDYQYLHKHYKQLIGKLENVRDSSSDSDSSDSDAEGDNDVPKPKVDEISEENGWKQKLSEKHQGEEESMEAYIEKLKQNTEEQSKEISDLKQLLDKAIKDKEAAGVELSSYVANMSSENENLKLVVKSAEREAEESLKTVALMGNEIRTLSSEKQITEQERDDLRISIVDLENMRDDLSSQLQETVEKCSFLSSQLEKAQLAEKEVQTLLSELEKIKNENLMLSMDNDNLNAREHNLGIECLQLKETIVENKAKNDSLIDENYSLERKLQLLGVEIDGLIVENEDLKNNLSMTRRAAAEEKERLESDYSKCLNELEKAQSSIEELEKELESTKGALNDNIVQLHTEKDSAALELQQLEASLKNLGDEMEQQLERISIMQKNNEDLELAKSNLHNELAAVQGQKSEAVACIIDLESKLEGQNQQISDLQGAIEDLKAANADMCNEVTVHQQEKNEALVKLEQLEAHLMNLKSEFEQQQKQISVLQQDNEELLEKKSSLDRQLEEARTNHQQEITVLQGEKEQALDNLQQSNTSINTLEGELEKQRHQNSSLQLANEDLHKNNANLEKQLEDDKANFHAELLALQEDKNKALSQLQQSEISINNLQIELEQVRDQISILHRANEDMKDSNYRLDKQLEEARASLHAEIVALREEKDTTQLELQQSLTSVRNYEAELEKQSEDLSALHQANDELQMINCALTKQFDVIKIELHKEVEMAQEEKDTALAQLKEISETSIKNLEIEVAQLKEEISVKLENNATLNKQLEEATLKVSNLHKKLETVQAEAASQLDDMNTKTKDLEKTTDLLSSQKTRVEEDLKIVTEACLEKVLLMKDFEDRVKQKITDRETTIACLQQSLKGILSRCQGLQCAYKEVSTMASQLDVLMRKQTEKIYQLEEKNTEAIGKLHHLEEEKLYANKENTKLQNHVQELEAQLQLAKQKLKVTEAESKCKEDSYLMAVETSHSKIQHLEQKIQQFSGRISSLEETLIQLKENAESGVSTLAHQLDEIESHFNQSFGHFTARLFACSEELKLFRNMLHNNLDEQKQLVKENDELGIRLREKENVLSEMVISASESKEKMAHLEKIIDEKEEEILARVQEKREAINQLSDAIIYHKTNNDDLIRYIRVHNRPRLPFCL